ncbi:MAG: hypothetical protein HRT72_05905 [Flavobacteriales bacterium]|nr:hypothetical protein [Flavobacteriales bacterium]
MKTTLLLALTLLILISCNKNQRQVIKIDGKWNVKSADMVGLGTIDPDVIYEFEYCKLKKDGFCEFSIHNFDTDDITSGIYSISENGMKLNLSISDGFGFELRVYDIIKISNRKLILANSNAGLGEFSRIELRSVD